MTYSYHIFMFPFRWTINGLEQQPFGKQISFNNIHFEYLQNWERVPIPKIEKEKEYLYNEKNYFYEFVHDALYDKGKDDNSNVVRHYERIETKHQNVQYSITVNTQVYELVVDYINLNLYSTGVGVLSFYMKNEKYESIDDVLKINQYGRRVYPPYFYAKDLSNQYSELAKKLEFHGLNGTYEEDFQQYTVSDSNNPASYVEKMIHEVASNIEIRSVIDDRMYVMSWYKNDELANSFKRDLDTFLKNNYWYKYVFVDGGDITCHNDEMQYKLVEDATYKRWQKQGSLYANSRYSFVFLTTSACPFFLTGYFETEYARMAELVLVQKASILRFSAEVTNLSSIEDSKGITEKVSSLYKEYIRFVNQIHFREVSAQDQAIEIYEMLYKTAQLESHVKKLDEEIGELHNYVSLRADRKTNDIISRLTLLATIFVPATFLAGIFGMNNNFMGADGKSSAFFNDVWVQVGLIAIAIVVFIIWFMFSKKGGKK